MPSFSDLAQQLRWQDVADVVVLTAVLYRTYRWLRGTVAVQVAAGILMLAAAAYAATHLGLLLTAYLLQALGAVATLVVVVVFQGEIRRALGRVSPIRWWRERHESDTGHAPASTAGILARAAYQLSGRRLGALVVVPGLDNIDEHLTGGVTLDAAPSPELFESVFHTSGPIHDGACVMQRDRVRLAGCFLPVSTSPSVPEHLGSRHRAAVGLSELCDAAVVVVSEETGQVSLVQEGAIRPMADAEALRANLGQRRPGATGMGPAGSAPARGHAARRRPLRDTLALAGIFVLVVAAWWAVVGAPSVALSRSVSVELRNIPAGLQVDPPSPDRVAVQLHGPRALLDKLTDAELEAWVDLSGAESSHHRWQVRAHAPPGVSVTDVVPHTVSVRIRHRR